MVVVVAVQAVQTIRSTIIAQTPVPAQPEADRVFPVNVDITIAVAHPLGVQLITGIIAVAVREVVVAVQAVQTIRPITIARTMAPARPEADRVFRVPTVVITTAVVHPSNSGSP